MPALQPGFYLSQQPSDYRGALEKTAGRVPIVLVQHDFSRIVESNLRHPDGAHHRTIIDPVRLVLHEPAQVVVVPGSHYIVKPYTYKRGALDRLEQVLLQRIDPALEREQVARLQALRGSRDEAAWAAALDRLG